MPSKKLTDLDFNNQSKVINLPNPTSPQDAATKAYVDSLVGASTSAYIWVTRAERYRKWLAGITSSSSFVRYASPNGSTSNTGSRSSPWPLQYGMNQIPAGGVLILLDGVYSTSAGEALLDCNDPGTSTAPITVAAENLHGARLHSTSKLFGVRVNSAAVYVRIAGLEITGVSNSGIVTYANYTDTLYNYVHDLTPIEDVNGGAGINYIGTSDQVGGLCEGNHIHDIGDFDANTWGSGSNPSTRVHGIYVTRSNATIRNNLIYRIKAMGITTWRNPKNNIIAYNTVYLCKYGAISVGAGDHPTPLADNNVVVGNIAAHSYLGLDESVNTGTNVFDRNLVWANTANLSLLTSTATNTTTADPLLIFPSKRGDFRPMFTSPVRRAGETTYLPSLDFDLLLRETSDIGCFAVREEVERQDAFGGASAFVMPWSLPVPAPPSVFTSSIRPVVNAVNATATTTITFTSNRAYWIPFSVRRTMRVTALTTEITTASAGTHTLYVYAANSLGQPTKRLASGTFDASTTGTKTITLHLPLEPGIYYIVWLAGSAAVARAVAVGGAVALAHTVGGTAFTTHFYTTGTPSDPAPTSGYAVGTGVLPAVGVEYVV
jgi:hypothetical protein